MKQICHLLHNKAKDLEGMDIMKFFIDTANIDEIRTACSWGIISGATTNPTLVSKEGGVDFHTRVREIAETVKGPVSAEAVSLEKDKLIEEAKDPALSGWIGGRERACERGHQNQRDTDLFS